MRIWLTWLFCIPVVFLFSQTTEMMPYLQTPSSNSMVISWLGATSNQSIVQYGVTQSLGSSASGSVNSISTNFKWHTVTLQNLTANTRYYYKCVTGSQVSSIYSFTTPPNTSVADGHLRLLFMGDSQYEYPPAMINVSGIVSAIQEKMLELYGDDWRQSVNLISHSGDIVEWAGAPDSFVDEYFKVFNPLTSSIPSMVARGNHDGDNYLYDFMATQDISGPESQHYYTFDIANTRFIYLDSSLRGDTQRNWLNALLLNAETNPVIDFVICVTHHFGHSEIEAVSSPESNWVQNTVLPLFSDKSKPSMLFYGHTHCYARGTPFESRTRIICDGGGGSDLDRWANYTTNHNYPEINVTMDYWTYTLVDIDIQNHSYEAKTFSLGNHDNPLDNVEVDGWTQQVAPLAYHAVALSARAPIGGNVTLVSSLETAVSIADIMSSQFQVSTNAQFTNTIVDTLRNWVDFYRDSGYPNYTLVNLNAGIDLKRLELISNLIHTGQTYYWRVRFRSQNTDWGEWSETQQFIYSNSPISADFAVQPDIEANSSAWFNDTSIGYPSSWAWDFTGDGITDSWNRDPIWMFNSPGNYSVTLRVLINGQYYTRTKRITVNSPLLSAPVNVQIHTQVNSLHLSWNPVSGASSYRVYYFIDPNNPNHDSWIETTDTQLTLTGLMNSTCRFFEVVAQRR